MFTKETLDEIKKRAVIKLIERIRNTGQFYIVNGVGWCSSTSRTALDTAVNKLKIDRRSKAWFKNWLNFV